MSDEHHSTPLQESSEPFLQSIDVTVLRRSLRTIMKPAITVAIDSPISQAVHLMQTNRIGCVLVTSRGRLLGIFTERDVLKKMMGVAYDPRTTPITEVMTANPQALNEDDTIAYALNLMDLGGYRHIPIVNNAYEPVGVVSIKAVVSYFVQFFGDEVLSLPPRQLPQPGFNDETFDPPSA